MCSSCLHRVLCVASSGAALTRIRRETKQMDVRLGALRYDCSTFCVPCALCLCITVWRGVEWSGRRSSVRMVGGACAAGTKSSVHGCNRREEEDANTLIYLRLRFSVTMNLMLALVVCCFEGERRCVFTNGVTSVMCVRNTNHS